MCRREKIEILFIKIKFKNHPELPMEVSFDFVISTSLDQPHPPLGGTKILMLGPLFNYVATAVFSLLKRLSCLFSIDMASILFFSSSFYFFALRYSNFVFSIFSNLSLSNGSILSILIYRTASYIYLAPYIKPL